MPSVPGKGGKVAKRSDQVRRKPRPSDNKPDVTKAATQSPRIEWPDPDADWHPIAVDMYLSFQRSGMAQFYEPTDVSTARYVCEAMSRNLNQGQRISGQLFASIMAALGTLGVTEGDRRRMRIELERTTPVAPPSVAIMAAYREAASDN